MSDGNVLVFDPKAAETGVTGISRSQLMELAPELNSARQAMLADLDLLRSGGEIPKAKQPLDAGFIDLPDRLLTEYRKDPNGSEVGRILRAADQLAALVDRVVVIGIGGSYMGTRSLFEALSHPYHNQLNRQERNERPRLYFIGHNVDNDSTQALQDLLGRNKRPSSVDERWGIVVVSKSGTTLEPAVAFRQFLGLLRTSNEADLSKLVVAVTGDDSDLDKIARSINLEYTFPVPNNVGGRYSILSACGLLPAAVLGLDIVKLLDGASLMNQVFRSEDVGANPVLDYAGVCRLMEKVHGLNIRVLSFWDQGLESVGFWYDQLLSESLGKQEKGATPLTAVNTRDLHSRGQQHQEGRRDKLITNVTLKKSRREPLLVGPAENNLDKLDPIKEKTLPEVMQAAIEGTRMAYHEVGRPTTDIYLPFIDEFVLGQVYQMLMLATVVEGYMIAINPYGQPGVEAYKKHMTALLMK